MSEAQLRLLEGVKVIDFGVGMAAALVAKFLAEMGAEVHRVEPLIDDPFIEMYPAYKIWRGQEINHDDLVHSPQLQNRLIEDVDICIVGGEDFPGLDSRRDANELCATHPRLVILQISGYPPSRDDAREPAADILVQARAGIVYTLHPSKPVLMSCAPASYGAMLQALTGIGAALLERETSGRGQIVSVSLLEGALYWVQPEYCSAERPTPLMEFYTPKDARPIILPCRDGVYVHIVLGGAGSKSKLYRILGIGDPTVGPNDSGLPNLAAGPERFFGDIPVLSEYVARRESGELLRALWDEGVVAEAVLPPGSCWDDAQVRFNGIIQRCADGTEFVGNPVQTAALSPAVSVAKPLNAMPLSGIRVIDFGAFVAGPIASVALADLGADVIKVEPLTGDPMRAVFKSFAPANRGKRSIAIDMKNPQGLAIAHRLCESADVVCSNFRPGVAARLGIDGAGLHAKRPGIIVLNNPGYGSDGPKASNAAFDPAMQAACGHEFRAGGVGNSPLYNRFTPVDFAGGAIGTAAILFALYRRARCRLGAELTVPLLNAGVFLLSELTRKSSGVFVGGEALDGDQAGFLPSERIYQTNDGWIAICARGNESQRSLAIALDVKDRVKQPGSAWSAQDCDALGDAIKAWRACDLRNLLQRFGVWAEICREDGVAGILDDPVLNERGTIYTTQSKELGCVRGIGSLFRLSRSKRQSRGDLAQKGEQTREVLTLLGYGNAEIESLYAHKVVA